MRFTGSPYACPSLVRISLRSMPVGLFVRSTWAVGMGAVGYADRSASCVSPSYALLPFLSSKRRAEGAAVVSPDLCREAAANLRAEIHRSAFAIRAACEKGASSPRLWATIRRSFSRREVPARRRFARRCWVRKIITGAAISRYARWSLALNESLELEPYPMPSQNA